MFRIGATSTRYLFSTHVLCLALGASVGHAQDPPVGLTMYEGVEDYAVFSPDGRSLAYAASEVGDIFGGNWDVWLYDMESGERRNVTATHDGDDRFPSFSASGKELAFWSDREGGAYFVQAIAGGEARRITNSATFASGPAAFSPDGSKVSVIVREGNDVLLETLALEPPRDSPSRRRLSGKSTRRFDLAASPDGRFFAYVDASSLTAHVTQLFVLDSATGLSEPITDGWANDVSPFWSPDGNKLYWISNRGGKKDIWRQKITEGRPTSQPVEITSGVGIRHANLSKDGNRIVYSKGQTVANVYRVPILADSAARWEDAEAITDGDAYIEFISLSPDGASLVTTSDASGNPDLWRIDLKSKIQTQLTHDPTPDWGPEWSPDGTRIGFYAYRSGNRDLWALPASGGTARQLTDHPAADMYPTWSPDGTQIAFYSVRTGNRDLWVMPSSPGQGGDERQLTHYAGDDLFPHWSPDGTRIAFFSDRDGAGRIWAVKPGSNEPERLTSGPGRMARFSRDGSKLYFTGWAERLGNLYELDFESGRERAVTQLTGRPGNLGSYVLATDDVYLYFTWERNLGDLFLAPNAEND